MLLDRLRRDRVPVSERRVRQLFHYSHPGTGQPTYNSNLPYP